jgi:hypothetical protein
MAYRKSGLRWLFQRGYRLVSGWMPVLLIAALAIGVTGCSSCNRDEPGPTEEKTRVYGTVTLSDDFVPMPEDTLGLDGTRIFLLDLTGGPDTLLRARADAEGYFDTEAVIPGQGAYTLRLYRNERRMADTTMLLAHQDTVRVEGSLPRFSGSARFHSAENEAMRTLNRLERQYNRIIQIAAAGGIARDTIPHVLDNWSSIFWEVWDNWPGTVAARIAARESLRMLEDRNDELLMQRLRDHGTTRTSGCWPPGSDSCRCCSAKGLDAAITWADSLEAEATSQETSSGIAKNRIEVLYDSSRIDEARTRIRDYETLFVGDRRPMPGSPSCADDVEELAPGMPLPSTSNWKLCCCRSARPGRTAPGKPFPGSAFHWRIWAAPRHWWKSSHLPTGCTRRAIRSCRPYTSFSARKRCNS